jgi:micrococcal nuclease
VSRQRPERFIGTVLVLGVVAAGIIAVALLTESRRTVTPVADGPTDGVEAMVAHVTDGDTIVVTLEGTRERVRYIGLDAPEVANAQEGTPAECGGDDAREANADLVSGREVVLERDVSDRDRFGRLLRHVWITDGTGWLLVGERLVEAGAVEARSYPPDTTRDAGLDDAERRARDAGLGIWGSC